MVSTVNNRLHSQRSLYSFLLPFLAPLFALGSFLGSVLIAPSVLAEPAQDREVLRVEVPLLQQTFRDSDLQISQLIADNTYIDVDEFNLRAVELEASSERNGEVRLKVGRYVTPPVPLPEPGTEGLLRIEAPHKSNKAWRLLIDNRVQISSLTAVLEPRRENVEYYESRYEQRGYSFDRDYNYGRYSRQDNWPYSWLNSDYDIHRRAGHWYWLNDSRTRFHLNRGYGFNHRHTRDCYDRFGRHRSFGSARSSSRVDLLRLEANRASNQARAEQRRLERQTNRRSERGSERRTERRTERRADNRREQLTAAQRDSNRARHLQQQRERQRQAALSGGRTATAPRSDRRRPDARRQQPNQTNRRVAPSRPERTQARSQRRSSDHRRSSEQRRSSRARPGSNSSADARGRRSHD